MTTPLKGLFSVMYIQLQSWQLRDLHKSSATAVHKYLYALIMLVVEDEDRPHVHNIGFTTLLFMINVHGFF